MVYHAVVALDIVLAGGDVGVVTSILLDRRSLGPFVGNTPTRTDGSRDSTILKRGTEGSSNFDANEIERWGVIHMAKAQDIDITVTQEGSIAKFAQRMQAIKKMQRGV